MSRESDGGKPGSGRAWWKVRAERLSRWGSRLFRWGKLLLNGARFVSDVVRFLS